MKIYTVTATMALLMGSSAASVSSAIVLGDNVKCDLHEWTGSDMSKLTITEAARVVGVSRMTLYKHIKSGRLSVGKDQFGKPSIDASELVRVFGDLKGGVGHGLADVDSQNTALHAELKACREVLSMVRQELDRALEREAWLQARIESAEQKLLTGPDTKRRWWWPW